MPNPPRPKFTMLLAPTIERVPEHQDVAALIKALFDVLDRHDAGPDEGVLALLTSFVEGASRILDRSTVDDAEHNRESLLAMLEHARRTIDTWSTSIAASRYLH